MNIHEGNAQVILPADVTTGNGTIAKMKLM